MRTYTINNCNDNDMDKKTDWIFDLIQCIYMKT